MIRLTCALNAWGTPEFGDVLKREIEQLNADALPLQQGLSAGNYVADRKHSAMILGATEDDRCIHARAGIFYTGILTGCACADDPTPENELVEYCEIGLDLDKTTGETAIRPLPDRV
jgi:hypothetical protein